MLTHQKGLGQWFSIKVVVTVTILPSRDHAVPPLVLSVTPGQTGC